MGPSGTISRMQDLNPDTVAQIIATVAIGVIAVGGSIGGAILGAREGARATLEATKTLSLETEKQKRASVRLLLHVEIDYNLKNLQALRDQLMRPARSAPENEDGTAGEPEPISREGYARRLVFETMPVWARQAWDGMTELLSPALSREEIVQANHIYGQLETISGIRDQLAAMANEKPHMEDFFGTGPKSVHPVTFHNYAPGLAADVDKIITDLLNRGNPIAEA
jgi:hypothetical protein